uniref:C-methyltransferase domain-containing protein n=1 Tax=viral metagenome TaxID=1070528 RepID=A0A6C0ACW0_9ZZZZ
MVKYLFYGSKGYIGSYIKSYISKNLDIEFIEGLARCENYEEVNDEIKKVKPDRIISVIGRSKGKNIYNSDFVENQLDINIKDNLYSKMVLVKCASDNKIHFTHIGDGSIFEGQNEELNEEEIPNLKCSNHSIVKVYFEKLANLFGDNYLSLRIANPISGDYDPRCFLSKIISYEKIINKNVSVSVLEDIVPILLNLVEEEKTGVYNLVNPVPVNMIELKIKIKEYIDSTLEIKELSEEEHNNLIGERSHVILKNEKISNIPSSSESLEKILKIMQEQCFELKKCLCCLGQNKLLLNLGYQPLANHFHEKFEKCEIYPLKLMYCENCFHAQLSHSVDPEILFKNYKYVSGTSKTGLDFFEDNAKMIDAYKRHESIFGSSEKIIENVVVEIKNDCDEKFCIMDENSSENVTDNFEVPEKVYKVLDIACNDGSQLDYFKKLGWNTYGIDPAENICPIAEAKGHKIICDFWNAEAASKLPVMDVITCQNVFAHTRFVDQFLEDCKLVMDENSKLFIQTSQREMIEKGQFDTCYAEHLSFFNSLSMKTLLERHGLILNRILDTSIHGRSYIFEIQLGKVLENSNVSQILEEETKIGLFSLKLYENFHLNALRSLSNLKSEILKHKKLEKKIIGFGAAAKAMTVLCFGNIDLDYIIDENELKIGLLSPKMNIPVVNLKHFEEDKDEDFLVVCLAWNFADEIIRKINKTKENKKCTIIRTYFPMVEIIE